MAWRVWSCIVVAALCLAPAADAAYPGDNGLIAFGDKQHLFLVNPYDGSTRLCVENITLAAPSEPAWSTDGTLIAYKEEPSVLRVWRVLPSSCSPISQFQNAADPTWSPDATSLAFIRAGDIWKSQPNGSGPVQLTFDGDATGPAGVFVP